jgi:predicted nucleic acid-binding protein
MNLHFAQLSRWIIVYLDNCCYSRLTDKDASPDMAAEAAKIQTIIDNRFIGGYVIVGGFAVSIEMGNNRDDVKRTASKRLYDRIIIDEVDEDEQIIARATELESMKFGPMDARHLAAAEAVRADYLLTVDRDFITKSARPNITAMKVINPLFF